MPSARHLLALLALAVLCQVAPAHPQDDPPDRVERFREFLARSPFHDAAFQGLVSALDGGAPLARFAGQLERELAADPEDPTARVLLARVLRHQGRPRAALEVLDVLTQLDPTTSDLDPAGLALLRARCLAAAGQPDEALAALELAAPATSERELAREIHGLRALALIELGRDADAALALDELARFTSPTSLARAEIAERAEVLGLDQAALAHWNAALELAGDEPADRARALRGLARLHTARGELELALEAWSRTDALLGHEHWMRPELDAALLELHAERGTLNPWITSLEAQLADEPTDRARRATLVHALEAVGRQADACAALRAGTMLAPHDLALAHALFDALVAAGDPAAAIREARRALLGAGGAPFDPDERELHFELAALLARGGEIDAAQRELEQLRSRDPDDLAIVDRAAALWFQLRAPERATTWLQRAAQLEPDALARHAALARHDQRLGRDEAARTSLARATELAFGDAARLAELADLQLDLGEPDLAEQTLAAALRLEPGALHLLTQLAELRQRLGDVEGALDTLRELCRHGAPGTSRERAAQRFAELAVRNGRHARRLDIEVDRAARGEADAATYLVIAAVERQLGRPERALAALRLAAQRLPADVPLRRELAAALERAGERQAAIEELEALRADAPHERARLALELARLHGRDQPREMLRLLREAQRDAPSDLGVLLEVARLAEHIEERTLAKETLERATHLAPKDAALRLRLGLLLSSDFEHQLARPELGLAYLLGGDETRARALRELYDILLFDEELEAELERLRARASRAAPDLDAAELFVALLALDLEHAEALEVLDRLIARRPREPRFYALRARLASDLRRDAQALADYEMLRRLGGELDPDLTVRMLELALRSDDLERARALAREVDDPLRAAKAFRERGQGGEALALLDERRALGQLGPEGLWQIAELCQELAGGDGRERRAMLARAADALEDYERLEGPSERGLLALGAIHQRTGARAALDEVLRRLFERGDPTRAARAWIDESGLGPEWFELGCEALRKVPDDEGLLRALSREAFEDRHRARRLLELVGWWLDGPRADLRVPRRHEPDTWRRALIEVELALYRAHPFHGRLRRTALARRFESGAELDERAWTQLLLLSEDEGQLHALERRSLDAALAAHPDSALVLAAAASRCARAGEQGLAAELWLSLAERQREPTIAASLARERELALADWEVELGERLGYTFQRGLPEDTRAEVTRATFTWDALAPGGVRAVPAPEEVARDAAAALAAVGRAEEARGQLDALEELAPGPVFLADALLAARAYERAPKVLREVRRLARSEYDAVYAGEMRAVWNALQQRCVENGDPRRAYQLGRYAVDPNPGVLDLAPPVLDSAREAFEAAFEAADSTYGAHPTPAAREELVLRALELIDFELANDGAGRAAHVCNLTLASLPEASPLYALAARLAERAGEVEQAIRYHEALAADAADSGGEKLARLQTWPGRTIRLDADREEIDLRLARWRRGTRFVTWQQLETDAAKLDARNALPHWVALLRLNLERDDVAAAVRALEQILAGGCPDPESWADHLTAVFRGVELGDAELRVQRAIYSLEPKDFRRLRALVKALLEAGERDTARALVEAYDPAWAGDRKYPRQWFESTRRELGIEEGDE